MKLIPFVMMLIAFGADIPTIFLYGVTALSFSFWLVIFYFLGLIVEVTNAAIQVALNPGIEKLEPSFWSSVYNAWLYRTNPQKMDKMRHGFRYLILGASWFYDRFSRAVLARPHMGLPRGTYESWFAGFFLTCSIAWVIVSADYWKPS